MAPISTPCTRICRLHPVTGICEGCGRSLEEITNWARFSEGERREIMRRLPGRLRDASSPDPARTSGP